METATPISQGAPATEQGFSASTPTTPTDMQQAMRAEHGAGESENLGQPQNSDGLYAGKYQSVEALVDGYKNLQTTYDARYGGFTGAPEGDYEYSPHADLADSEFKVDPSSDSMQRLNTLAKELNMSQDTYNHLLNIYTHEMSTQMGQATHDGQVSEKETYDNYISDLGGNEEAVHRQTEDMIVQLTRIPGMADDAIESLVGNISDSKAFTAMQQLLSNLEYSSVPGSSNTSGHMSENDLMERMQDAMKLNGMARERAMDDVSRLYQQYYPGMANS
tara:strand:+ start:6178 stop:7005 length:828 start_codon:yes stop_codon:yes gene_type:complete